MTAPPLPFLDPPDAAESPAFRLLLVTPSEEPRRARRPPVDLRLESAAGDLAIRVPDEPRRVRCEVCDDGFLAAGPTGFSERRPVCDRCLFDLSPQLGMVLALVSVTRSFGQLPRRAGERAADELVAFSRVYEAFAAKHGPRRELVLQVPEDLPS